MTLDEIFRDIHAMEEDLLTYERKYGVLSDVFYESYRNGEEPADNAWVLDWSDWAGAYEIWLRRRRQYQEAMNSLKAQTKLSIWLSPQSQGTLDARRRGIATGKLRIRGLA